MITNNYKDFKNSLRDSEEYTTLIIPMNAYNGLNFEMDELIYQGDIRQHNSKFESDETHKELVKRSSEAKKQLRNYEFKLNHK
tara:strand:- start:1853 stop:2101 length:249 start_codon:yes stop_codon:yes gene_type:complete